MLSLVVDSYRVKSEGLLNLGVLLLTLAFAGAAVTPCYAQNYSPEESAVMRHAGDLYAHHDLNGAIEALRKGVARYPDSAQLHFMLGNALMRGHAWRAAIPEYSASVKLRPQYPDVYLNLGYALYHARMTSHAVDAWRTASQQSPRDALIHASLALGLLATGNRPAALEEITAAQELDPAWRHIAAVDFRWNDAMRADADNLAAGATLPSADQLTRRTPGPELGRAR